MIEINQISKSYQDTKVLDNITTTIKKGGSLLLLVRMGQGNQRYYRLLAVY